LFCCSMRWWLSISGYGLNSSGFGHLVCSGPTHLFISRTLVEWSNRLSGGPGEPVRFLPTPENSLYFLGLVSSLFCNFMAIYQFPKTNVAFPDFCRQLAGYRVPGRAAVLNDFASSIVHVPL
jgi:hypothetical protein